MKIMATFLSEYLAGNATLEDIDDYIEIWHTDPVGEGIELYNFLGLTWNEYTAWVMNPNVLKDICESHRK